MPDVVTPSAFSPAANATKTVTPTAPVKSATPPPATGAPSLAPAPAKSAEVVAFEAERAKLADERRMLEIRMQRNQKKYTEDARAKEAKFAEREARLVKLEKERELLRLNPEAFYKTAHGDDWYDKMVQVKLSGGAPTGDVIKSELDKLREEFAAERKADKEEQAKTAAAQQEQGLADARRQVVGEAARFWTAKAKDFPLVDGLGTPEQIAGELGARIERHYLASIQRDEDGRIVVDGVAPSVQTIADAWEGELVKLAERAAAHEKYAEKFKPKPAEPQTSAVQQPRRTLSNDLTGSTPGQRPPPANNEEKRARAAAAYLAARKPAS